MPPWDARVYLATSKLSNDATPAPALGEPATKQASAAPASSGSVGGGGGVGRGSDTFKKYAARTVSQNPMHVLSSSEEEAAEPGRGSAPKLTDASTAGFHSWLDGTAAVHLALGSDAGASCAHASPLPTTS